jgi:hypothetical protein
MDFDPFRAGPHELGVRRVPDVLHVDDRVAGLAEALQHLTSGLGRGLRLHQRIGATREVVALDVDDEERPGVGHRPRAY